MNSPVRTTQRFITVLLLTACLMARYAVGQTNNNVSVSITISGQDISTHANAQPISGGYSYWGTANGWLASGTETFTFTTTTNTDPTNALWVAYGQYVPFGGGPTKFVVGEIKLLSNGRVFSLGDGREINNNLAINGQVVTDEPVNLGTGASFSESTDSPPIRLPGETLSAVLTFQRYQSSANAVVAALPGGWTHNYNITLTDITLLDPYSTELVLITDGQASVHSFKRTNTVYSGDGFTALSKTNGNFVWRMPNGTQYLFDGASNNRLSNITDRVGSYVALQYSASNQLTSIVDSSARTLTLSYAASNQLASVIDPISRTNSYTYDTAGRLTNVSDALGTKAQYSYGESTLPNAVTAYINANGYTNSFAYNSLGQTIAQSNTLGKAQTFTWIGTNQQVIVTDFDGSIYTNYNDTSGAITARVDAAGTILYQRDDRHQVTNLVDRLGNYTRYLYDTNMSANGFLGNLLQQIDPLGRTNRWSYESTFNFPISFTNANGGVTLWAYDNKGNLTTNTDAAGNVTTFGYDSAGNQTSLTDANQHTTTFGYDQYGNCTSVTDPLNHAAGFTYDLVGRRTGLTDALGRSESFTWDARDRLTYRVNAAGETNSWSYDGNGNQTAWTDPLGHTRNNSYDAADRLIATTLPSDSAAFITYGYDDMGNRVSVTDVLNHQTKFGYDALGRLTSTTNALNKVWSFAVDAEGRRTLTTDPNQHSQSFGYDAVGQLSTLTNALNQVTTFNYDRLGNLTTVTDPRNNSLVFGYNAVSRLSSIAYAGGSHESFSFDGVGNVTSITNRAGQVMTLTYDAANRMTQKSYVGTSDVVNYGYNSVNQLTGVVASVSSGNSALAFAYDAVGRLTNETQTVGQASPVSVGYEYYADGRRKKLVYPDGSLITYVYNDKGWLTDIKDGGTNTIVSYQYNAAGLRTNRTLENNTITVYDYDAANQLTSIWHKQGANTISRYQYGYDDAGNRKWVRRAHQSDKGDVYGYDAADQLVNVKYNASNPDGSPSSWDREVTYAYDAAGNRTNLIENLASATNSTGYVANNDNQLTSAAAARQGFTVTGYVSPGSRSNKWYNSTATSRGVSSGVSQQNGTFSIPGVPVTDGANALTVTVTDVSGNIATQVVNVTVVNGTAGIGYDANGNQTNDAIWSYGYDTENKLKSANNGSLTVNYSYDARGRLIGRTAGNSTNRMYYAGWQLIAEYDGAGNLQKKYVYGTGVDESLRVTASGTNYYYQTDGLSSVTELTDTSGAIVEQYRYDVYGSPTVYNASGMVTNASAFGNRLLFTGRDRDLDTGWYNYRHRYYNPSFGRFVQPDQLGIGTGDANFYTYCSGNPTGSVDPFGLCKEKSLWTAIEDSLLWTWYKYDAWGRSGRNDLHQQFPIIADFVDSLEFLGSRGVGPCGMASGGMSALGVAAKTTPKLLNPGINVTEQGMQHVLERHIVNGISEFAGKSKFTTGVNLQELIQQGTQMPMVRQANGNFARTFDAGRAIGVNRATGQASSTVTIITGPNGNLITMFPGAP